MEFPGAGVGSNSDFRSCPWTRCGLNTNPEPARVVHYIPNLMTSTQFSLLGFCEAHMLEARQSALHADLRSVYLPL